MGEWMVGQWCEISFYAKQVTPAPQIPLTIFNRERINVKCRRLEGTLKTDGHRILASAICEGGSNKFFNEKFITAPFANAHNRKTKKRQTHRYDHISLLRFRPGEVLQELVARRRRKGSQPGKVFKTFRD